MNDSDEDPTEAMFERLTAAPGHGDSGAAAADKMSFDDESLSATLPRQPIPKNDVQLILQDEPYKSPHVS